MIQIEYALLIATVGLLIGVVRLFYDIKQNLKQDSRKTRLDIENDLTDRTRLNIQMENVAKGVTDITHQLRSLSGELKEFHERLVLVEASAKDAQNRLTRLEKH